MNSHYYYVYDKKEDEKKEFRVLMKQTARYGVTFGIFLLFCICLAAIFQPFQNVLSPVFRLISPQVESQEERFEVFGFLPWWSLSKVDNVDFNVLTTLAYFGVPVKGDGTLDTDQSGYRALKGERAQRVFAKARAHNVDVVLTLTQMDNDEIKTLMDDQKAQDLAIAEAVALMQQHEMDGINIDFEYVGNPGEEYRAKFSQFVKKVTEKVRTVNPEHKVTVSVYASAAKFPKLYNIKEIAEYSDAIFMMAYDFATSGSDKVMPTAPLYGHKEGKYWYDISTAVDDFLVHMPADKLILGLPWYGYNYPVVEPSNKPSRHAGYYEYYYRGYRRYSRYIEPSARAQTYASATTDFTTEQEGWDDVGKVGWKAYQDESGMWRMIFLEDARSLGIKYDYAKQKELAGVGVWALGFDHGKTEMWSLLSSKFGTKLADSHIRERRVKRT